MFGGLQAIESTRRGSALNPDLAAALLGDTQNATPKKAAGNEWDEEALEEQKAYRPDESANVKPSEELPNRLRRYRQFRINEEKIWGKPLTMLMYILYMFVAVLITAYNVNTDSTKKTKAYAVSALCGYALWQILCLVNLPCLFWGRRSLFAWGGLIRVMILIMLNLATLLFFLTSFNRYNFGPKHHAFLLVFMAATVFFDQQIVEPLFRQKLWYYHGAISSKEFEAGEQVPISGIGTKALKQVATNASKAVGISDEAIESIKQHLDGNSIREGQDEALDDWTLIIYKLGKVVSFVPFCRSKTAITSGQYRNLISQMIIYIRSYMDTGKISEDELAHTRTAPLSFFETFATMFRFSMQVPCAFFLALIPRSFLMINQVSLQAFAVLLFVRGITTLDKTAAFQGLALLIVVFSLNPILSFLANIVESSYSTKVVDNCRRKMLGSALKGGTEFDEAYPSGKLIDAFSNHLAQLEIYAQYQFITCFSQLVALVSGMITVSQSYPFACILFVSLLPVMLSIDYFTKRASHASNRRAENDGQLMGKLASAVECRKAIRAGNAGSWVREDLQEILLSTKDTHRSSFLKSTLVQNFTELVAAFYIILILLPLGMNVIHHPEQLADFMAVTTALHGLVLPIFMLGLIQNQTSQFSGSVQAAKNLMDSSLDEERPSITEKPKAELKPLVDSIELSGVQFRYSEKLPDVIKGVNLGIHKGSYVVLCGGSGSGKTTVLNLVMRFREPYAGSINWDGTSIYGATLESFRSHVSVMFQQTMIYMGTVRDNILFGMPEEPGAVEKAAQDAEIDHFITALPDGYDTIIGGDATGGMSGGQLQRVCLARALYRKPSVLLLDEATSALDNETEHAIIETLVNLRDKEGLTIVSVSHHPSTAVKANTIVMLNKGVIAEEGPYDDLVSREEGLFRRLVEAGDE